MILSILNIQLFLFSSVSPMYPLVHKYNVIISHITVAQMLLFYGSGRLMGLTFFSSSCSFISYNTLITDFRIVVGLSSVWDAVEICLTITEIWRRPQRWFFFAVGLVLFWRWEVCAGSNYCNLHSCHTPAAALHSG